MLVVSCNSASCLICVVQVSVYLWGVLSPRLLLLVMVFKILILFPHVHDHHPDVFLSSTGYTVVLLGVNARKGGSRRPAIKVGSSCPHVNEFLQHGYLLIEQVRLSC